jgi:prophage antirepressor-like protein
MKNSLFDGVGFALDRNGNPAYRFEDVFRRFEGTDAPQVYEAVKKLQDEHGRRTHLTDAQRLSDAWGRLHDFHKAQVDEPGPWLTEAGVYKLAGDMNSAVSVEFQRWRDTEVLPSIRKTGGYQSSSTEKSSGVGKTLAEQARTLRSQADLLVANAEKIEELEFKQAMLDQEMMGLAREVDTAVEKLDTAVETINLITGGSCYRTVRLRALEWKLKLSRGELIHFGGQCMRRSKERRVELPPPIQEGSYLVNQYPIGIIDEVFTEAGYVRGGPMLN